MSTRFTKPSVEQIIGYGYDHPQKMMDVLINIWSDTKNIECGQNVFDLSSQGLLTSLWSSKYLYYSEVPNIRILFEEIYSHGFIRICTLNHLLINSLSDSFTNLKTTSLRFFCETEFVYFFWRTLNVNIINFMAKIGETIGENICMASRS